MISPRFERSRHGRQERRTIQVLPAPEGIFPYAQQVFLAERYVHDLNGALTSAAAALGITALSAGQAGPERLADLIRGHWGIEALHHIRDVTYDEDRSQLRTGSTPQILAGLRNLAIGALRTAGRTNIASSLRWISRNPTRAGDRPKPWEATRAWAYGSGVFGEPSGRPARRTVPYRLRTMIVC